MCCFFSKLSVLRLEFTTPEDYLVDSYYVYNMNLSLLSEFQNPGSPFLISNQNSDKIEPRRIVSKIEGL